MTLWLYRRYATHPWSTVYVAFAAGGILSTILADWLR